MGDQTGLPALRERIGRMEVELKYLSRNLLDHGQKLENTSKRLEAIEDQLAGIERLLRTVHRVTRWGLASVGTMFLEAITGTLRSVLHTAATLMSGFQ